MLHTDTENSASEKLANLYHLDLNKEIQSSDLKKKKITDLNFKNDE